MPQWKVTLATTKKTPKKTAFSARAFYDTILLIEYYTWEFMLYRVQAPDSVDDGVSILKTKLSKPLYRYVEKHRTYKYCSGKIFHLREH